MEVVKIDLIEGKLIVVRSKVFDFIFGGYILMEFWGVVYNIGLFDFIFSEWSLCIFFYVYLN